MSYCIPSVHVILYTLTTPCHIHQEMDHVTLSNQNKCFGFWQSFVWLWHICSQDNAFSSYWMIMAKIWPTLLSNFRLHGQSCCGLTTTTTTLRTIQIWSNFWRSLKITLKERWEAYYRKRFLLCQMLLLLKLQSLSERHRNNKTVLSVLSQCTYYDNVNSLINKICKWIL